MILFMKESILKKRASFAENIKPSLIQHMHDSMLYKINETITKQDSSDIENDGTDIMDIYDIGGS